MDGDRMSGRSSETMTHELKCLPEFFRAIADGTKPFEVRLNDRRYQVGDRLYLNEYDPESKEYTSGQLCKIVTYVMPGGQFGLAASYVVLGLADPPPDEFCKSIAEELPASNQLVDNANVLWREVDQQLRAGIGVPSITLNAVHWRAAIEEVERFREEQRRAHETPALPEPVGYGVFLYNGRLLEVVHTEGDRAYQASLGGREVKPLYTWPAVKAAEPLMSGMTSEAQSRAHDHREMLEALGGSPSLETSPSQNPLFRGDPLKWDDPTDQAIAGAGFKCRYLTGGAEHTCGHCGTTWRTERGERDGSCPKCFPSPRNDQ